jgi:nitroreductase
MLKIKYYLFLLIGVLALNSLLNFSSLAADNYNDTLFKSHFTQLLQKRYSGYQYDPAKQVTREQLKEISEAGRLAPSSYNEQPWAYIICDRNAHPEAYQKAFSALVEFNQNWAKNAPVLIVCIAATKSARNGKLNPAAQYDTGAATFAMVLKAASMGLMAHQMGGFDADKIKHLFAIPNGFEPMSVMAIGYASSNEVQPERTRKPLGENFFMGSWGSKFE